MSSSDDILLRILSGELEADSPEARAAMERDPGLRARLADCASLEKRIATIGEELRTGAEPPIVGEDATLARFRDVVLGGGGTGADTPIG